MTSLRITYETRASSSVAPEFQPPRLAFARRGLSAMIGPMTLDFSSLRHAVGQLQTSLAYARSDMARDDPALATQFRAATIQAFEFTYERVTRSLRRWLTATEASPDEVDALTFPGLIRLAHARGLVREDVSQWRVFRDRRGTTSHAYDEAKAQEVFDAVPRFLDEARHVAEQLERRATQA